MLHAGQVLGLCCKNEGLMISSPYCRTNFPLFMVMAGRIISDEAPCFFLLVDSRLRMYECYCRYGFFLPVPARIGWQVMSGNHRSNTSVSGRCRESPGTALLEELKEVIRAYKLIIMVMDEMLLYMV